MSVVCNSLHCGEVLTTIAQHIIMCCAMVVSTSPQCKLHYSTVLQLYENFSTSEPHYS